MYIYIVSSQLPFIVWNLSLVQAKSITITDYIIFYKYFGLVFHKLLVLFLKYKTNWFIVRMYVKQ